MNTHVPLRAARPAEPGVMTLVEFEAFYDEQPEGERWELIDGIPVMSPSPTEIHQVIAGNIAYELGRIERDRGAQWRVIPGIALPVPGERPSAPIPDVMVLPKGGDQRSWKRDDALVAIEILSPSSLALDLRVKPRIYAAANALKSAVIVDPDRAFVVLYDRANGWEPMEIDSLSRTLTLTAIDATLALSAIYRDVAFPKPRRKRR